MTTRKRRRGAPIHSSIKERLGYDANEPDDDIYEDWKTRTTRQCKPCWELKYCPYGPLVEQLPMLPPLRSALEEQQAYFKHCLETGTVGTIEPLSDEMRATYQEWLADEDLLLRQGLRELRKRRALEEANRAETDEEKIAAWLGRELPPVHIYRAPYDIDDGELDEEDFEPEIWQEIVACAEAQRERLKHALATGQNDGRLPLEPVRRAWFKRQVDEFVAENYPDTIPERFTEAECNVFGHICPVFFTAEAMTETQEERRIGRRRLNFTTMMRIVRRDDYRCQHCQKQLRDTEVEFDHIIPVSKGGSSEEHNLRLTCFDCNRDKSDEFSP